MTRKRRVVFGLLGTVLDAREPGPDGQLPWRPSIALNCHPDLPIDRFVLLCQPKFAELGRKVEAAIRDAAPATEVDLATIEFADPWSFPEVYKALFYFARGYAFRPEEEEYLVHLSTGTYVIQICLNKLTESRHIPGRLLQTAPPKVPGSGEPGSWRIIDQDLYAYEQLVTCIENERQELGDCLRSGIPTRNPAFNRLIDEIGHVVVHSRSPVLLMGPTGAGKSQLARRIHDLKKTRHLLDGRLVEVNCATLRGDNAMSALFGHVKGAFTGAVASREGLLRAADGGMLFLDEIGELGLDEQAMLLRALEDKHFMPVGADREVASDFELIVGTNRDLSECVRQGIFREDLLARLDLWTFHLPGLKDRPEDIEPNIDYEIEMFAKRHEKTIWFTSEARTRYLAFAVSSQAKWSGNFRDLNASVTRMGTLAHQGSITLPVVLHEIDRLKRGWGLADEPAGEWPALLPLLGEEGCAKLDRFDAVQLTEVVRVCREAPSLSEAGRRLFAVSRGALSKPNDADRLRKYLAKFGLSFQDLARG